MGAPVEVAADGDGQVLAGTVSSVYPWRGGIAVCLNFSLIVRHGVGDACFTTTPV